MKKRNFKELKKEDLKLIKGGRGEVIQNGDDEYVVDIDCLPIEPQSSAKRD